MCTIYLGVCPKGAIFAPSFVDNNSINPKILSAMETIFFRCPICGNIMLKVSGSEVTPHCCGRPMERLEAGTTDGKTEYHVPTIKCCKDGTLTICIGHSPHPMTEQHYIQFIYLETECGGQIQYLKSGGEATATFHIVDKPTAIYAYCNLHALWKYTIEPCPHKDNTSCHAKK